MTKQTVVVHTVAIRGSASRRAVQAGFAGIALLAILVMGSLYGFLVAMNTATAEVQRKRDEATAAALRRAKDALIAYAITYSDTHPNEVIGYLPCPDDGSQPEEGQAALSCGAARVSRLGRLPWKTLDVGPLRDSEGQCLWYAVSGTYKNNPKSNLMNWDTPGQFEIAEPDGVTLLAGTTAANRAVAVIFAPGAARAGAGLRNPDPSKPVCGGDYGNAGAYLDAAAGMDNSVVPAVPDGVTRFIAPNEYDLRRAINTPGGNLNLNLTDRVVFITAEEIWTAAKKRTDLQERLKRLTQKVAQCVEQAANANAPIDLRLPFPASMNISGAANGYYSLDNLDDIAPLRAGHLPYRLNDPTLSFGVPNIFGLPCMTTPMLPYFPTAAAAQNWYENWKDHFLYVVADEFKPSSPPTNACMGTCLTVGGVGTYAGIVIFGGQRVTPQQRDNKDDVASYLEGVNATNFQARYSAPGGAGPFNYVKDTSALYPEFAHCIQPNGLGTAQVSGECP